MEVVHCDNCGYKIAADAFSAGAAVYADDGKIYCAKCAPLFKDTTTALGKLPIPSKALGPDERTGDFAPVKEFKSDQSATKFYFCETCGKRITDKQILDGLGRDKKLKGVYCKDCAVGVMTMEFAALTDETFHPISKSISPPRPQSAVPSQRSEPRPSGVHLPAPKLTKQLHSTGNVASGRRTATSMKPVIIGASIATFVLIALVLAITNSSAPVSKMREKPAVVAVPPRVEQPATVRPAMPEHGRETSPLPVSPSTEQPLSIPVKSDAETLAAQGFEKLIKFEGMAPDDKHARIAAVEEFLKLHGNTIVAARARTLIADLRKNAESAPTPERSLPVDDGPSAKANIPSKPPEQPIDPAEARKTYTAFHGEFIALLCKHDRSTAAARLEQAKKNSLFTSLQNELAQDSKALVWLEGTEALMLKGLERLREADDFELQTTRERIHVGKRAAYQIADIKDGRVQLATKEVVTTVLISDLTPQTCDRLMLTVTSDDAAGFLQRAFVEVLALNGPDSLKAAKAAQTDLAKARTLGASDADANYVSGMLDANIRASRETIAEEMLARFEKNAQAKNWSEAIKTGRQLLDEYSETTVVQKTANLKERVEVLIRECGPVREYTLTFQEGQPIREVGLASYAGTKDAIMFFKDPAHKSLKGVPGLTPVLHVWQGWLSFVGFTIFANEGGALPDKTEIIEAKLSLLELDDTSHEKLALFRILSPWKPDEVSWDFAASKVRWKTPGADCEEKAAALAESQAKKKVWCEFDITESLTKAKKEGKNYGWLLTAYANGNRNNGAGGMMQFAPSSYADDPLARPKLILKVRCPKLPGDSR